MEQYLNILNGSDSKQVLIIARVPWPLPKWALVLKALTPLMRSHGMKRKDVFELEGMLDLSTPAKGWENHPDMLYYKKASAELQPKLEAAFAGTSQGFAAFWLYEWKDQGFALVREPITRSKSNA